MKLKEFFIGRFCNDALVRQSELILKQVGDVLYDYGLYSDKISILGRYQFPLKLGGSPFIVGGWLKIPIETRLLPKAIFVDDLTDERLLSALRSITGCNVECRYDSGLVLPSLFTEKPKQGLGLGGVSDFWYLVELNSNFLHGIPRKVKISGYPSPDELDYQSIPIPLGISQSGVFRWLDLYAMRSTLICGATRTGKSVYIRSVLDYLFTYFNDNQFQAYLLDLKFGQVEFGQYNQPGAVLYDNPSDYVEALLELAAVRFKDVISPAGCRSIVDYNQTNKGKSLPYILCVVDEFAAVRTDKKLMVRFELATSQTVGAGIIWMIATQRPSVDVVSGSLKANVETRIGFSFSSVVDSKVVFDMELPETVRVGCPGRGRCLSGDQMIEFQGAFVA